MAKKRWIALLVILLLILAMCTNAIENDSTVEQQTVTTTMKKNEVKRKKVFWIRLEENLHNGKLDEEESTEWNGQVLTAWLGTVQGPSGRETYYNLPMSGVISIMRDLGYSEEEYPYWIREDGCKMLGEYIMIVANLQLRPRGTIVETSLGLGLVCDTGGFAHYNEYQIDVAVNW